MKNLAKIIIQGAQDRIQYHTEMLENIPSYAHKDTILKHIESDKSVIAKWSKV